MLMESTEQHLHSIHFHLPLRLPISATSHYPESRGMLLHHIMYSWNINCIRQMDVTFYLSSVWEPEGTIFGQECLHSQTQISANQKHPIKAEAQSSSSVCAQCGSMQPNYWSDNAVNLSLVKPSTQFNSILFI